MIEALANLILPFKKSLPVSDFRRYVPVMGGAFSNTAAVGELHSCVELCADRRILVPRAGAVYAKDGIPVGETDDTGRMAFRTLQVFGDKKWEMIPAVNGQMVPFCQLYRDWKLGAGDALLKKPGKKAALALDFAFT